MLFLICFEQGVKIIYRWDGVLFVNPVKTVVNTLIDFNIITPGMRQYYEYAIEIMAERLLSLASMCVIAIALGKLIPALLFLGFFLLLRRHTGGYHANSFILCYVESLTIFTGIMILGDSIMSSYPILVIGALCISFVLIMFVGTINHPKMNFSVSELSESKKSSRYVLLLEFFIILSLNAIGASERCLGFMSWGIILCAISIVLAKITKQEVVK